MASTVQINTAAVVQLAYKLTTSMRITKSLSPIDETKIIVNLSDLINLNNLIVHSVNSALNE